MKNEEFCKPRLAITTIADQPLRGQKSLWPVNVCRGGNAATITTRYDGLSGTTDIISLAHFPKTVVLIEYESESEK